MKYNINIPGFFWGMILLLLSSVQGYAQSTKPSAFSSNNLQIVSTEQITICNNQLPYLWNGITCLIAGTYSATLTATNGADSIATLQLSVINVGLSITNVITCNNQLPYIWNGNSYSANGTYSVTLTSSSGCDSVPILSLTVNDVVYSTTNKTICINQVPFVWNGNNYSASGAYMATLVSAAGCDSIATLNLVVKPVSSSTTNILVCANTLPYNWNGQSYPATGTYQFNLIAANGCDSVATLNLSTKPLSASNSSVNICASALPYNWNGNSYASAGTYSVTLTGANGCDSVARITINVRPLAGSTSSATICSGQLPYSWNGNSYPSAGTYTVIFPGSNGCDSIARLRLTVLPFVTSFVDRRICFNVLPYSWNGNSYSAPGAYAVSFVTASGCDSIVTLNLTVDSVANSALELIICNNDFPYNWYGQIFTTAGDYPISPPVNIGGCDVISTLSLIVQPVLPSFTSVSICNNLLPYSWNGNNYSSTGSYGVTLTSTAGCDSLANLNLTVTNVTTSNTDITICNSELPYVWNGNSFPSAGIYTVTLASANGCDSLATLNLNVNNVSNSTTILSICTSQLPYTWNSNSFAGGGIYSVILVADNGCDSVATLNLTVLTFLSSTSNIQICNNQLPYNWNGVSYTTSGTYLNTLISVGGCDSVVTLILDVIDSITSTTIINTCNTQLPFNWNGNNYSAAGSYTVTLISSTGCDSVATLILLIGTAVTSTTVAEICNNQLPYSWNGNSYPVGGSFPVTLTSTSGCDSTAILELTVTDVLTSNTNVTICSSQLPYLWNNNSYSSGGTYSVTLTTAGGCDSVPILSLALVPYITSTTAIRICNNDLPFSWNGNIYSAAGSYAVLLSGTGACDSLATLNLSVLPPISSTSNFTICNNAFPFSWNGNSFTAPGTYSVTLTSSGGCDSTTILELAEIPVATGTSAITICSNQLPYNWNGNSYAAPGVYSVVLITANGCDSTATLTLTTIPTLSGTSVANICNNQLPYTWNGNNYNSSGNFPVTLAGSNGCDSIATLMLTVSLVLTSTSNISTCQNNLPFLWNGNSYTIPGTYSITLTSSSGCDSIATLNFFVNPVQTSISNISVCETLLPFSWNGNQYAAAGTYQVTLISNAGCDSIATLNLQVNSTSSSTTIINTCSNQLPFIWNGNSYTTGGTYQVTLINSLGCDSITSLQLNVNPVETSQTLVSICSSELPFTWNGQNYLNTGTFTVTLTSTAGCDSIANLNLTVQPTPLAPFVSSPVTYCQHQPTLALLATITTAGSQLNWHITQTGGIGSPTAPIPSSAVAGDYIYYVSQINGSCEGVRIPITVIINSKPDLGADQNIRICYGTSADFSNLYNTAGYLGTWTYNQLPVNNLQQILVAGNYQLVAINNFGCADTALVNLGIQPPITAHAGIDADIEYNVPYQLNGSGGGQYQWSPGNLLNNPFIANPVTTLTGDNTFVLIVMDEIGCLSMDTVRLRVLNGPTFYVPNAFTPDADGLNDIFKPIGVGIASLHYFRIFNRYGEQVFETSEIGKGWDGNLRGVKQNPGNYVWMLKATDRKGKIRTMKGNVVLIR